MPNFIRITPCLNVQDLDAAVRFFVEVLGFHAWVHSDYYAYVQRETAAVRLHRANPLPPGVAPPVTHDFEFYIDVQDVAAVVAELTPRLLAANRPAGQGPVDQTWGMREFWVAGPEGGTIVFGQEVVSRPVLQPKK